MTIKFTQRDGTKVEGEIISEIGDAFEVRVTKINGSPRKRTTLFSKRDVMVRT